MIYRTDTANSKTKKLFIRKISTQSYLFADVLRKGEKPEWVSYYEQLGMLWLPG
jgi:hypothetical protein